MASGFDLDLLGLGKVGNDISLDIKGEIKVKGRVETKSRIDTGKISTLLKLSLNDFARELDSILKDAIGASIWRTREGDSDIIDSGDLLNSQTVTVQGTQISIDYDVPYAALVHYGGYILPYGNVNATRVYLPPRPWVAEVLAGNYQSIDLREVYKELVRRLLSNY
jgi:phage gpG-like protein